MQTSNLPIDDDTQSVSYEVRSGGYEYGYTLTTDFDCRDELDTHATIASRIVSLEVLMPVLHGITVCRQLGATPETVNDVVITLSTNTQEANQLLHFLLVANNDAVRVFSAKVLLERVRSMQNRFLDELSGMVTLAYQGLVIDRIRHQVKLHNIPLDLTPSEFRLLETLMQEPGRAYDRKELISFALGEKTIVLERTIDVHIRSLRRKLGEVSEFIETVRGVGYRFNDRRGDLADERN